jgi:hypothetical protein
LVSCLRSAVATAAAGAIYRGGIGGDEEGGRQGGSDGGWSRGVQRWGRKINEAVRGTGEMEEEDGEQERARGMRMRLAKEGRKHDVVTDDWVKDGGRRVILGSHGPGSVSACLNEWLARGRGRRIGNRIFIFH